MSVGALDRVVETFADGKPYDLFVLTVGGTRVIGRKTEAEFPGPGDAPLKCSLVQEHMLLGEIVREQVAEDHVAVYHRPLGDTERAEVFAAAVADPMTDLHYPYAQLGERVRAAAATGGEYWQVTDERVRELDHAEIVLRDYVPDRLAELGFTGTLAYDAACSTGAFLSSVGRRFPGVRTVGQDLSAGMVEHARSRLDEVHHGDSAHPAIGEASADLVVCRHLNAFVVGTDTAHTLFAAAVSRCRPGGVVVLLGHTPILVSGEWCQMSGLRVLQRSAATPSGHALYQCYVLRRGDGDDPRPGTDARSRDELTLHDVERAALATLPAGVRDFVAGGSGDERTLAANRTAWGSWSVVPRVLRDVSSVDTATTLLGCPASVPVAVAPVAYHRLLHPDGELASARAAHSAGVPFTVATLSSVDVADVVATGATTWLQLYWLRDRAAMFALVDRAQDAGVRAIVLTVDVPWMGRRHRDVRNGFHLPTHVSAAHFAPEFSAVAHATGTGSSVAAHTDLSFDPSLNWADVDELRARTRVPLVLKGVLAPLDAARAVEHGVDAVIVSNHGGRQLDGAVASADALGAVRDAVAGRCQVLVDGGVRSGVDVLTALALGASGVLVGRPVMWGLATGGADGAGRVLGLVADEFRDALGLAGCATVPEAGELAVVRR